MFHKLFSFEPVLVVRLELLGDDIMYKPITPCSMEAYLVSAKKRK